MTRSEPEASGALSLLELLRQSYKTDELEAFSPQEEAAGTKLPDGYVRRSPVQPYADPPGGVRRPLKALILCAAVLALALLGLILWRVFFR